MEERARRNGVPDVERLGEAAMRDVEPFVRGAGALYSPHTAAVDYVAMCDALVAEIERLGDEVLLGHGVTNVTEGPNGVDVHVGLQRRTFDQLIVCAGLQGDALARMTGQPADMRIVPFRGEYYVLRPERRHLVQGMIYPVPDSRYPFLGVHLTRDVHGGVHVGPNAVLALALEGYRRRDVDLVELGRLATWPGSWRLAATHWRHAIGELASSLSTRRYLASVREYLPDVGRADLVPSDAGVRAQAVDRRGRLLDDFVLRGNGPIYHVRNAPSPAATSSLAIAEHVVSALSDVG